MTRSEISKARGLLADHTERSETIILDTGGQALTVHFHGGGQRCFYSLDEVYSWLESHDFGRCTGE